MVAMLVFTGAGPVLASSTNSPGPLAAKLSATCRGPGTLRPDYNGSNLVVGKTYTMVARPEPGYVFTNWTDGYATVLGDQSRLKFIMGTNSVLIANFIKRDSLASELTGISIKDLPGTVLARVNAAPPETQPAELMNWLSTVAGAHPAALPSVIATVLGAHPELSKTAVATAAAAAPSEIYGVVYAAAQASRANLAGIVAVACGAAPESCYRIAQAILDVDPAAGKIILQTIAATVPELKAAIGAAAGGTASLSKNQTLRILTDALNFINWSVNPAPPNQNPHDYSTP